MWEYCKNICKRLYFTAFPEITLESSVKETWICQSKSYLWVLKDNYVLFKLTIVSNIDGSC